MSPGALNLELYVFWLPLAQELTLSRRCISMARRCTMNPTCRMAA